MWKPECPKCKKNDKVKYIRAGSFFSKFKCSRCNVEFSRGMPD